MLSGGFFYGFQKGKSTQHHHHPSLLKSLNNKGGRIMFWLQWRIWCDCNLENEKNTGLLIWKPDFKNTLCNFTVKTICKPKDLLMLLLCLHKLDFLIWVFSGITTKGPLRKCLTGALSATGNREVPWRVLC